MAHQHIRIDPEHLIVAGHLEEQFRQSDKLAAFECCWYWRENGLPVSQLPVWATTYLVEIAADYFAAGPFARVTPRELRDMTPKERKSYIPSLDRIAGLSGRGKEGAWLLRTELARDRYIKDWLNHCKERAKAGENELEMESDDGQVRTIKVLDHRGRITKEFKNLAAKLFRQPGFGPGWSKAKSVTRRMKRVEDK